MPSTSVWTNSSGPRIDRSTWVSAAKLTIASHPAAARATASRIGDVSLEELVLDALEIRGIPGVGQLVEDCHLGALSGKPAHEVGADEPGPSGNEDAHRTRVPAVSLANDITLEKIPISRVDDVAPRL